MYFEAILLGVVIGWLRKGKIRHFFAYAFSGRYLALIALLIFVFPYALKIFGIQTHYALFPYAAMGLCALIALLNHRSFGMKLLFVGVLLNMVVMGMNHFSMPIDTEKLSDIGGAAFVEGILSGEILNYRPLAGSVGISAYLGKVVAMPSWYPFTMMCSVGDFVASTGIVLAVQNTMLINRKGDMLQFTIRPGVRK